MGVYMDLREVHSLIDGVQWTLEHGWKFIGSFILGVWVGSYWF